MALGRRYGAVGEPDLSGLVGFSRRFQSLKGQGKSEAGLACFAPSMDTPQLNYPRFLGTAGHPSR